MATAEQETKTDTIELSNIGPIQHAVLPFVPEGGIVVLKGPQGAGKSISLETLDSLATGKGKPPIRDRELHGQAKGFGVVMNIGRRASTTGEPTVEALEGKLSVADLVEPGIKNAEAADAKRIKALVQLAGAESDPSLFYEIVGGKQQYDAVVKQRPECDDIVQLAAAIKRDLEEASRGHGEEAAKRDSQIKTLRASIEGIDLTAPHDQYELEKANRDALHAEINLRNKAENARVSILRLSNAKASLESAESEYSGPTIEEAQAKEDAAADMLHGSNEAVLCAEKALEAARADRLTRVAEHNAAVSTRKNAESHAQVVARWKEQIETDGNAEGISPEELSVADQRVKDASAALERGVTIRKAIQDNLTLAEAQNFYKHHSLKAEQLRSAAKKTDDVLSSIVGKLNTPLFVENSRLVLDTPERGKTYFAELSVGQRWIVVIDIAAEVGSKITGSLPFIVIPQWAWGELQPANRKLLAQRLREKRVLAYTAQATDDRELNSEIFNDT